MKFFDCHVHFFPDALAGRALPRLAHIAKSPFYSDGTLDGTLAKMEGWRGEDEFAGLWPCTLPPAPTSSGR